MNPIHFGSPGRGAKCYTYLARHFTTEPGEVTCVVCKNICCSDLQRALQTETDNEGYGALLCADVVKRGKEINWLLGSHGVQPVFCP